MPHSDARQTRSRKALLNAGVALLIQNPMVSLSQIAVHAGVGRATLYRHFETREQLIQALAAESLEMTDEAVAPIKQTGLTGRAALEAMFPLIMPLADRYHFLLSIWSIVEQDKQVMDIYHRQLNELSILVEQGKAEGSINKSLDTNWIVGTIDSVIYTGWWMMSNKGMSAEVAAHHAVQTLFHGISS